MRLWKGLVIANDLFVDHVTVSKMTDEKSLVLSYLTPRQNGRRFTEDVFKCIFWMRMYEFRLRLHWSLFLRFQLTIFQHWFGDKPLLFEPLMARLLTQETWNMHKTYKSSKYGLFNGLGSCQKNVRFMMTSSSGSIFCVTGLCAGNSQVTGEAELWYFL